MNTFNIALNRANVASARSSDPARIACFALACSRSLNEFPVLFFALVRPVRLSVCWWICYRYFASTKWFMWRFCEASKYISWLFKDDSMFQTKSISVRLDCSIELVVWGRGARWNARDIAKLINGTSRWADFVADVTKQGNFHEISQFIIELKQSSLSQPFTLLSRNWSNDNEN